MKALPPGTVQNCRGSTAQFPWTNTTATALYELFCITRFLIRSRNWQSVPMDKNQLLESNIWTEQTDKLRQAATVPCVDPVFLQTFRSVLDSDGHILLDDVLVQQNPRNKISDGTTLWIALDFSSKAYLRTTNPNSKCGRR